MLLNQINWEYLQVLLRTLSNLVRYVLLKGRHQGCRPFFVYLNLRKVLTETDEYHCFVLVVEIPCKWILIRMEPLNCPDCQACNIFASSLFFHQHREDINPTKTLQELKRGEQLFTEKAPAIHLYCIKQGRFALSKSQKSIVPRLVDIATPGTLLGVESLVNKNQYFSSSIALDDSLVCRIEVSEFILQTHLSPPIMANAMKYIARHIDQVEGLK